MIKRTTKWVMATGTASALSTAVYVTAWAQTAPSTPPAAPAPVASVSAPAAAPMPGASATAPQSAAPPEVTPPPKAAKSGPPAPTPEQLAGFDALKTQVAAYEQGAREYRETLTDIIKLHYGRKKRELLAELDRGIVVEKQSLKEAQLRAIARLEKFVEDHSGKRAHPESTPDAMFRLAALYEERARSDESKEDTSVGLMPAIALYKRIINEFPNYRELAGVYYFLGHAYNDSTRTEEAQQVWRSLVCHNHFEYPTPPDPKKADSDSVLPIPQDNTQAYWIDWRRKFQTPESLKRKQGPDKVYRDPYPSDCHPIAKAGAPTGEDPKYVQEVWWQIGNWEFDQLDVGAGLIRDGREPDLIALPSVYGYNRAASAYRQSLRYKNPNLIGVALYKYAWTLFKQQRYEAATREFVRLLEFTDEQQRLTGDPGSDFRAEAYTYIAGSLTTADFKGPEADEPYIPRPDVVEEAEASVAEKMLRVAIDRVKDPALIPQEKTWTIEIYRGLASEFRSLNHFTNAIDVYELMLKKWPMDPSAPDTQLAIAETYEQLNLVNNRPNTPEHDRVVGKVLEARAALANYVGNTKWVDANKDNPAAIQNAERLSKGALRAAAATLTNNARQALADAQQSSDPKYQLERLARALSEYRLAVLGWKGFIKQDENAPDVYESRYWLADAAHNVVRLSVVLHKLQKDKFPEPTSEEIAEARTLALAVRDSNEDDKFLENSAVFVVDLADVRRDLEYQRFEESKGASGTARRSELVMAEGPDGPKVVSEPLPASVKESIGARDEYITHVPPERDTNKNALEFQNYAAETYFLYGQFDEARARYEVMYKDHCGKNKYGYLAWEKLITMSNKLGDTERSRQLAEAEKVKSCAVSAEEASRRDMIVNPTLQEAAFVKARTKFKDAQSANPGPERDKLWREAAGMYEAALAAAPGRDEAPEAAMNAAYAYKQVGDYNKAIALYDMFIAEYGSDAKMTELQKGDPKAKKAPEPKKYEERVKYLTQAYDALSSTYYGFFNYQRAAETYEKIAGNVRFDEKKRKDSARNAMILYANMGARPKMLDQHKVLLKLSPSADEKANADFLVADYDYRQWNPSGGDSGQNKQTRLEAEMALGRFHAQNRTNNAAAKYVLEASYKLARMKRAGNDPAEKTWLKLTVANWQAFDRLGTKNADGVKESNLPPYADYGAEADFALVDADMREKFDYQTNHHRYAGAVDEIVGEYEASGELKKPGQFQKSVKEAENWKNQLDRIVSTYKSVDWTPAALARQGSVYDSIRTALFETRAPALKYFTAREENLLKSLEQSGRDDLQEKADQYRDAKKDAWRERRDREIAGADEVAVNRYLTAVLIARQFSVRNAAVQNALARLAYLENVLGAAKMRDIVSKVVDPTDPNRSRTVTYTDDQFAQWRTGMNAVPPINGRPEPAPVAP